MTDLEKGATEVFRTFKEKLLEVLGIEVEESDQEQIDNDYILDSIQVRGEGLDTDLKSGECWTVRKLLNKIFNFTIVGGIVLWISLQSGFLFIYSDLVLNPKHDRLFEENWVVKEEYLISDNEAFNQLLYQTVFEEVDERGLIALKRVSELLPTEFIELLKNHNIQINFIDQPISNYSSGQDKGVTGIYNSFMKRIMLQLMNDVTLTETLLHEIGHFIADKGGRSLGFMYEDIAQTKTFKKLYQETKDDLMTESIYGYDKVDEYFAQVFMMYFQYPVLLEQRCPRVYEFMHHLIEDIVRRVNHEA